MASTYGYGKRTFVQGAARLCCHLARYFTKHNAKLTANLGSAAPCLTSMVACLNQICNFLNKSAP